MGLSSLEETDSSVKHGDKTCCFLPFPSPHKGAGPKTLVARCADHPPLPMSRAVGSLCEVSPAMHREGLAGKVHTSGGGGTGQRSTWKQSLTGGRPGVLGNPQPGLLVPEGKQQEQELTQKRLSQHSAWTKPGKGGGPEWQVAGARQLCPGAASQSCSTSFPLAKPRKPKEVPAGQWLSKAGHSDSTCRGGE